MWSKKFNKLLIIIPAIIAVALIGILIFFTKTTTPIPTTKGAPGFVNSTYGIRVHKGVVTPIGSEDDTSYGLTRLELYFDPLCPGCKSAHTKHWKQIEKENKNGKIELYLHPLNFLDPLSKDSYSTRAVAAAIRTIDYDPKLILPYLDKLYEDQPKEGDEYVPVTDLQLQKYGLDLGLTKEQAKTLTDGKYKSLVTDMMTDLKARTDITSKGFSTPTILIGGKIVNKQYVDYIKADISLPNLDLY